MSDLFEPEVLASLLRQWSRSLRARNRSPRTIETYTDSARRLVEFAVAGGYGQFDRALVEDYLADQTDRHKPATVAFRYRSLQQWCKWLTAEGELAADPMAGMSAPHVPEQPVPVLTDDQLRALLAACKGTGFPERRDTAIIRLFLDTGMRLSELWLGDRGAMTTSGIRQMLERRGEQAGVRVHPHMFRHTFAHQWKAQGAATTT